MYAVAKKFNPEVYQVRSAEHGAKSLASQVWSWVRGDLTGKAYRVVSKVKEYASESEPDEPKLKCLAHLVSWDSEIGVQTLSEAVCTGQGELDVQLLEEDKPQRVSDVGLCPKHSHQYQRKRGGLGCGFEGCSRIGKVTNSGVRLCSTHDVPHGDDRSTSTASRRSRSRSRARRSAVQDEVGKEEMQNEADDEDNGPITPRALPLGSKAVQRKAFVENESFGVVAAVGIAESYR